MADYHVAYTYIYSDVVTADSPEEAAEMVADTCPFDIDSEAFVTRIDTDETWEI